MFEGDINLSVFVMLLYCPTMVFCLCCYNALAKKHAAYPRPWYCCSSVIFTISLCLGVALADPASRTAPPSCENVCRFQVLVPLYLEALAKIPQLWLVSFHSVRSGLPQSLAGTDGLA